MSAASVAVADRPITATPPQRVPARAKGGALVLLAILLVAANLRLAVTSLGALLHEVEAGMELSPTVLGVVTALPTLAFAGFGALTPRLTLRFGPTPLILTSMGLLALGQCTRALTSSTAVFVIATAFALAGIAISNILLPALVKRYFPARLGAVTGLYTMIMVTGGTVGAAVAVPVAHAAGSWRVGLGVWAAVAVLALLPVLVFRRATDRTVRVAADDPPNPIRVSRTRLGWTMALFFGLQSFSAYALMGWLPQIYRDAGFSSLTAGLLVAAVIGGGLPMALAVPTLAARRPDQRSLVLLLAAAMLVAYVGLALAPRSGAYVWTALLAVGQGTFPLALALIGLRARTAAGTVALSTFTQSTGYLIAVAGPVTVGLLYDVTHGWAASLAVLVAALVVQAFAGVSAARPRVVEDAAAANAG